MYFSENEKDLYIQDLSERRFKAHGIPAEINEDLLKIVLQCNFEVEKVYSIAQPNGKFEGQAFVIFWNKHEAQKALEIYNKEGYLKLDVSEEKLSEIILDSEVDQPKDQLIDAFKKMKLVFPPQQENQRPLKDIPFKEIEADMEYKTLTNLEILHKKKENKRVIEQDSGEKELPIENDFAVKINNSAQKNNEHKLFAELDIQQYSNNLLKNMTILEPIGGIDLILASSHPNAAGLNLLNKLSINNQACQIRTLDKLQLKDPESPQEIHPEIPEPLIRNIDQSNTKKEVLALEWIIKARHQQNSNLVFRRHT